MQDERHENQIAAVVLAAGKSSRMGAPKMVLPWGHTTVIGQVVGVLQTAGVAEVLVVTGGAAAEVEAALQGSGAICVFNPAYSEADMTSSLQAGLSSLGALVQAALVTLGDQPQIEARVVRQVLEAYRRTRAGLVAPSYQMRRGHPWLIDQSLWPEALALDGKQQTLRDLLKAHAAAIHYVAVDTPSILSDIDTPEDYHRSRPAA